MHQGPTQEQIKDWQELGPEGVARLRTLYSAVKSWRDDYLKPKYGNEEWKCPYVKAVMDAAAALEKK